MSLSFLWTFCPLGFLTVSIQNWSGPSIFQSQPTQLNFMPHDCFTSLASFDLFFQTWFLMDAKGETDYQTVLTVDFLICRVQTLTPLAAIDFNVVVINFKDFSLASWLLHSSTPPIIYEFTCSKAFYFLKFLNINNNS